MLESAALALNNGCDLNCGASYPHAVAACERGLVSEQVITECCERVMRTRLRLGLFDPDCSFNKIGYDAVCCPEHIQAALDAARESIVLLKNDGVLPLKGIRSLGVIGPNAGNFTAPDRQLSRHARPRGHAAERSRRRGGPRRLPAVLLAGLSIEYTDKDEDLAQADDRIAEALAVADVSDAVVLFLGMDETIEGEEQALEGDLPGGDKESLRLPGRQQLLLEKLCETGKPVVLVMMCGSAMDLRYADEHCAAILQAWYPGARGGTAIADVLFGRVSPSGKLPVTFYRSTDDLPPFTDYDMAQRTYRYLRRRAAVPVRLRPWLRRHPPRRRGDGQGRRGGRCPRAQLFRPRRRRGRSGLRARPAQPVRAAQPRAVRLRARGARARRVARGARGAGQKRPHRRQRRGRARARQRAVGVLLRLQPA